MTCVRAQPLFLRTSVTRLRLPTDDSAYDSPRSPDLNEDSGPSSFRRPMANLVPNTLRKDLKNPLLGQTIQVKQIRTSSLDQSTVQLTRENTELNERLLFLEDKVRKLRRVRVLYTERDRQVKELQSRLSRLLQDIEELRESHPHLDSGLEALLRDLDEEDCSRLTARPVHVDELYPLRAPRREWKDPFPTISDEMEKVKARFRAITETSRRKLI